MSAALPDCVCYSRTEVGLEHQGSIARGPRHHDVGGMLPTQAWQVENFLGRTLRQFDASMAVHGFVTHAAVGNNTTLGRQQLRLGFVSLYFDHWMSHTPEPRSLLGTQLLYRLVSPCSQLSNPLSHDSLRLISIRFKSWSWCLVFFARHGDCGQASCLLLPG